MDTMTSTARPRPLPPAVAAGRTLVVNGADGAGTALRALDPVAGELRPEPPPALLSPNRASGPTTKEAA